MPVKRLADIPLNLAQQRFQMLFKLTIIHKHLVRTVGFPEWSTHPPQTAGPPDISGISSRRQRCGGSSLQLFKIRLIENAGVAGKVAAGPQSFNAFRIQHTPTLQRLIDRILLYINSSLGKILQYWFSSKLEYSSVIFFMLSRSISRRFLPKDLRRGFHISTALMSCTFPLAVGSLVAG